MGKIALNNIQLFGYHGVLPVEKSQGNAFEIDARVEFPFEESVIHDKVESTFDYGILFECVKAVIEGPSRNLLETLILEMERRILEKSPRITALNISLRKLHPPLDGDILNSEVQLSWPR